MTERAWQVSASGLWFQLASVSYRRLRSRGEDMRETASRSEDE